MRDLLWIEGRSGRLHLVAVLLLSVAILFALVFAFMKRTGLNDESDIPLLLHILALPVWWLQLAAWIRRGHDLGRTGWFCLLFLVPVVNLLFMLYLLLAPGEDGANDYG